MVMPLAGFFVCLCLDNANMKILFLPDDVSRLAGRQECENEP